MYCWLYLALLLAYRDLLNYISSLLSISLLTITLPILRLKSKAISRYKVAVLSIFGSTIFNTIVNFN